ncbi:MAG: TlpA disulfide reductase family protein [Gammaproteobacteria bacterium]
MQWRKGWIYTLALTFLLIGGAAQAALKENSPAPDFALKSRSGPNVRLSELRGQVVMINFWATWCGPCRQEMPLLESLYKRYRKLGFTLLGVNVEENSRPAERFLKDVPVSFPILYDNRNEVSKLYQVSGMPSTVIIDRDGKVRFAHTGYVPGDESKYSRMVRKLIRE